MKKVFTIITLLSMYFTCTWGWAAASHGWKKLSRRSLLETTATASILLFTAAVAPDPAKAAAAPDNTDAEEGIAQSSMAEEKKREKERRQKEKEAKRLAEETKKRLAVGRIGTI